MYLEKSKEERGKGNTVGSAVCDDACRISLSVTSKCISAGNAIESCLETGRIRSAPYRIL